MKIALGVAALLGLATVAAALAVIWTGDARWGPTAGIGLFLTVIAGGIAGAISDSR